MMEAAITQILLGDAAMVLQFGNEIYWGRRPQSATGSKYLTMQVISWPDSYVSSGADRLSAARVQFDVWGHPIFPSAMARTRSATCCPAVAALSPA
ncbi:hypothetical protein [Martelella soudanensis]|uniref:hypothetical protein n=1 Tax=Martelella sp. NC18 TaxID=2740297 RepID=UPI0015DD5BA4|nr:hypothetical protein [Martelella sp. NC18]